jgi:squalene-hopene/tetraprenyl-beta-curcumene cyclase
MYNSVEKETFARTRSQSSSGRLDKAIGSAVDWLLDQQDPEGFWVGMLESNSCMEAQWILAMHFLGIQDERKRDGMVSSILNEQREDGSWEVYHNALGGDINTTVECYAALRAARFSPDSDPVRKAREWIFEHGGLSETRMFTRYWLAIIGEWPWQATPTLPPELIYAPLWFPFNIYHFASWARATIIPLTVLSSRRPVKPLPEGCRLDELFPGGRESFDFRMVAKGRFFSWESFFFITDRLLSRYVASPFRPGRGIAIRSCIDWIVRHQDADGAWGGIQPPWIYSLMALNVEGCALDHPVIAKGIKALDEHWSYERDGGLYIQASESPVWDTLLSLQALLDTGHTPDDCDAMTEAVNWLVSKQVTANGDWEVKVTAPAGGWSFERANDSYPDIDDTAVAILVLARARAGLESTATVDQALERAVRWVLAMQCTNGGWASFDRDNNNAFLTKLPFCDFGEVLDPPTVDVTAHVVEALAYLGWTSEDRPIARALAFIRKEQETDGSWFGRWGVNHIYGTAAVLPALAAIGADMSLPSIQRAGDWVANHQNGDGGWGETPASYVDDSLRGVGSSTASQTAWALLALLAIPTPRYNKCITKGIEYLLDTQTEGTWHEPQYTGTGFPGYGVGARVRHNEAIPLDQGLEVSRGFMINYNLYRHYFPLMALSRVRTRLATRHARRLSQLDYAPFLTPLDTDFLNDIRLSDEPKTLIRRTFGSRSLFRKTARLLKVVPRNVNPSDR